MKKELTTTDKVLTPEQIEKKAKRKEVFKFIFRLLLYIAFGLAIPMGYLIQEFKLFSQTTALKLGGWGLVVIIFTAVFMSKLIKQSIDALESEFAKQCLNAIRKVLIPLLSVTLCLYAVGNAWDELIKFFIVLTICEPIAYIANPFPTFLSFKEDINQNEKMKKIIKMFWDNKKD